MTEEPGQTGERSEVGEDAPEAGSSASRDPNVDALIRSASRWLRESLRAWADDDYAAIALLAPLALEHLGKATLWSRHPSLLVPLASNGEESLRILAGQPDLADSRLRTIGLGLVLQRLERYIDPFPLSQSTVRAIVETRNGSVHVGLKGDSKHLLREILNMCQVLLKDLEADSASFYGDQERNVRVLLEEKRSEVEATVAAKLARARNHLTVLEDKLGPELFEDTSKSLEAEAPFAIDPLDWSSPNDTIAINCQCPECGSQGRLIGRLDADPDVEWEIGDEDEIYAAAVDWNLHFTPQDFVCNVCKLALSGYDELAAAEVRSRGYLLDTAELDETFDVDEYTRSRHPDYLW